MSHFNVSLIVRAKSPDNVHKPQVLKRKDSRSGSNRGPSAYQPNALPLGHTGSQSGWCPLHYERYLPSVMDPWWRFPASVWFDVFESSGCGGDDFTQVLKLDNGRRYRTAQIFCSTPATLATARTGGIEAWTKSWRLLARTKNKKKNLWLQILITDTNVQPYMLVPYEPEPWAFDRWEPVKGHHFKRAH